MNAGAAKRGFAGYLFSLTVAARGFIIRTWPERKSAERLRSVTQMALGFSSKSDMGIIKLAALMRFLHHHEQR